jgi:signal transduction histidine kinase
MFVMPDANGEPMLGGLSVDVTEQHHAAELTRALLRLHELGSSLPELDLLAQGLAMAEKLAHSPLGFLHLVDDAGRNLTLLTQQGQVQALPTLPGALDQQRAWLWAQCGTQQAAVVCNSGPCGPPAAVPADADTPLQRMLAVPVLEGQRVCLMLGVANKSYDYDAHDTDVLQLLGNDLWRITQRRRSETLLRERVDELVRVNQQLSRAHLQLLHAEKMASIGQLTAGVAHELNNPIGFVKSNLGTLQGYLHTLAQVVQAYEQVQAAPDPAQARAALAQVQSVKLAGDFDFVCAEWPALIQESLHGVERISQTVRNLRDFARADAQEWQSCNLHDALESALAMAWHTLSPRVELVRAYEKLPDLTCQPSSIRQVMLSILMNSAQAIEGPGRINVRTGTEGPSVWVEVQDNGCGMSPDQVAHAFEPFFSSKPVGQNPGLGLAIAWQIVHQHGGHIGIDSAPGRGTTVRVTLPLVPPNATPTSPT